MFVGELSSCGLQFCWSHLNWDVVLVSTKGFLDIQATIECGFSLKRVRDVISTYSQMYCRDKYSEQAQ